MLAVATIPASTLFIQTSRYTSTVRVARPAAAAVEHEEPSPLEDGSGDEAGGADAELQEMIRAGLIDPEDLLLRSKKKVKKPKGGQDYWDSLGQWSQVTAGDDFLLGAADGGFAGLEVLEGYTVLDPDLFATAAKPDSEGTAEHGRMWNA